MSREFYELKLPIITAIPKKDTLSPAMPVITYLEEAEFLHDWCQPDMEALVDAGLNPALPEDVPVRSGALRHAQTIWHGERHREEEADRRWKATSSEGYDLRDVLLHTFRHAYEGDPRLLARVAGIAVGYGHADMIQDLSNLAGLGRSHSEPLANIRFNMGELDRAANLSSVLARMWAGMQVDRTEDAPSRVIRDQAYTHLKHAVDAIRSKGNYVFWRNEERLRGYASEYHRRKNAGPNNAPAGTNDPGPATPGSTPFDNVN